MTKYIFTDDDCDWSDASCSMGAIVRRVLHKMTEAEKKECHQVQIYRGKKKSASFTDFFSVNDVIGSMQVNAYDRAGKASMDYLDELGQDEIKQLETLILRWSKQNNIKPDFSIVTDIEVVTVTIPKKYILSPINTEAFDRAVYRFNIAAVKFFRDKLQDLIF